MVAADALLASSKNVENHDRRAKPLRRDLEMSRGLIAGGNSTVMLFNQLMYAGPKESGAKAGRLQLRKPVKALAHRRRLGPTPART